MPRARSAIFSVALLAVILTTQEAAAQPPGGTHFRGIYIDQPGEEVKAALQSLHLNVREQATGNDWLKLMIATEKKHGRQCAFVAIDEGRINLAHLYPCFFDLDNAISSAEFSKEVARRFPVTKIEARPIVGTSNQSYIVQLATGETVFINGEEHTFLQVRGRTKNSPTKR